MTHVLHSNNSSAGTYTKEMSNPTYVPGVCNINHAEVRKRRAIGFVGLATLLITIVGLAIFAAPAVMWAIAFVPAFLMATGFLQAHAKFCVGYAAAGMRHVGAAAEHIADPAAVATDKHRARTMNLQAFGIAGAIAILAISCAALLGR